MLLSTQNGTEARTYALLCLVQGATSMSLGLVRFGSALLLYEQTGSAATFGTAVALAALPSALLMLVAGAVLDRHGPVWIVGGGALAVAVAAGLAFFAVSSPTALVAAVLIVNVGFAVQPSAMTVAATRAGVTDRLPAFGERPRPPLTGLGRRNVLAVLVAMGPLMIAPTVGSALHLLGGYEAVFLAALPLIGAPLVFLARHHASAPPVTTPKSTRLNTLGVLAGIRELAQAATAGSNLLFTASSLGAVAALEVLATPIVFPLGGAPVVGVVQGAGGFGMALAGAWLLRFGTGGISRRAFVLAGATMAGALVLFSSGANLVVSAGAYALIFAGHLWLLALNREYWQRLIPAPMQGRVFSTRGVLAGLGIPLGAWGAAPLAGLHLPGASHALGPHLVLVLAAVLLATTLCLFGAASSFGRPRTIASP